MGLFYYGSWVGCGIVEGGENPGTEKSPDITFPTTDADCTQRSVCALFVNIRDRGQQKELQDGCTYDVVGCRDGSQAVRRRAEQVYFDAAGAADTARDHSFSLYSPRSELEGTVSAQADVRSHL
eukprot:4672862-Pyramimonas_sp.AAC.2